METNHPELNDSDGQDCIPTEGYSSANFHDILDFYARELATFGKGRRAIITRCWADALSWRWGAALGVWIAYNSIRQRVIPSEYLYPTWPEAGYMQRSGLFIILT